MNNLQWYTIPERKNPIDECNQSPDKIEFFKEYAVNPKGFLLLAGKNGTGKTFAANAIYDRVHVSDSDYRKFITQTDLNLMWQKQIKDWGETTYLLNQMVACEIFVLDDLGTRTPTEAFMDFLYALISKRYERQSATIITTNLNEKDMREKFGDAIVSRIASGKVYRFDGQDRRFTTF